MHDVFHNNTGDASHGDAQSDIMGGGTITVMVLFIGLAVFTIILLMLLVQTNAQVQTQAQKAGAEAKKIEQLEKVVEDLTGKKLSGTQIDALLESGQMKEKLAQAEKEKQEAEAKAQQAAQAMAQAQAAAAAANANAADANANAAAANAKAAEAERKYEELRAKDKEAIGNLVSTGMRLWIFRSGPALITEADPMPDGKFWQQKFVCRLKKAKLPVVEVNPDVKSDHLLGK